MNNDGDSSRANDRDQFVDDRIEYRRKSTELNTDSEQNVNFKDVYPQVISSVLAFLFTTQAGINMVYVNLLLQYIDVDFSSWITSVGIVTTTIGAILSAPISDKFGRRTAHIIMGIPSIISWFLLSIADINEKYLLLSARILSGISVGLTTTTIVYVTEIAHRNYRGMLLSLVNAFSSTGILITTVLATFLTWNGTAMVFFVTFIFGTVMATLFIPESPYWLLYFGAEDAVAARKSIRKLNPNNQIEEEEWNTMRESYFAKKASSANTSNRLIKWSLADAQIYRPLIILMILLFLQQACGVYSVLSYSMKILSLINKKPMEDNYNKLAFLLVGVIRFLSSVAAIAASKYYKRRVILASSAMLTAIVCFLLAASLISFENKYWLNTSLFIFYTAVSCYGLATVPWTLIPELLPIVFKSSGSSFLVCYNYLLYAFFAKISPFILDAIQIEVIFVILGIISIVVAAYTFVYIPETFRKNVNKIAQYFNTPFFYNIFKYKKYEKSLNKNSLPHC